MHEKRQHVRIRLTNAQLRNPAQNRSAANTIRLALRKAFEIIGLMQPEAANNHGFKEMRRLQFYNVNPEAYLYPSISRRADLSKQKEEPIRQWCAFELMRAFGICLTDLEFERTVKVGSKKYFIDIVVLHDGAPRVVVECKEPGFIRHEQALEQAISYADARSIRAEYVIYTNGKEWLTKRRVKDSWVSTVNIPSVLRCNPEIDFVGLLELLSDVLPLLFALDQPLDHRQAKKFLSLMQQFFNGCNELTAGADEDLPHGLDFLLRALSVGPDVRYEIEKLRVAHAAFERFRRKVSVGYETELETGSSPSVLTSMHRLRSHVDQLVSASTELSTTDASLIRLAAVLLDWGADIAQGNYRVYKIPPNVHHALRAFLEISFATTLDLKLPHSADRNRMERLRDCSSSAWEDAGEDF
jgi:hypothetical protein